MTVALDEAPQLIAYSMIIEKDWDAIIALCAQHPACAQQPVEGLGTSLLHAVCNQPDAPLELVEKVVESHPDSVWEFDSNGYLPIHVACQHGTSAEVMNALVKQFPKTVLEKTRSPNDNSQRAMTATRLFWNYVCERNSEVCQLEHYTQPDVWPQMQALLEAAARFWNLETAAAAATEASCGRKKRRSKKPPRRETTQDFDAPSCCIHAAVALLEIDAPVELLRFAMWKYPEQIDMVDARLCTPLHLAVTSHSTSSIVPLVEANPDASSICDPNEQLKLSSHGRRRRRQTSRSSRSSMASGDSLSERGMRYPLHSALAHSHTWDNGIRELVESCSEAVTCVDPFTALYPYQMAAISGAHSIADLDTIYGLLRAEPGVLMADDDQEKGLGIMILQSGHDRSSISNEALLCLTSDDESIAGDYDEPSLSYEQDQSMQSELDATDARLEFRISRPKRTRSFVSFDDQAEILKQAAAVYQKRKESGFKDLGLQKHIDECVETRANLREIGDPEILRKKKIADFIEEFKRTKPRGKHTHGLSEIEVKERRANLRKVREGGGQSTAAKAENRSPPSSPIARARSRLRSANSPRKSPEAKKWVAPSTPISAATMPASPLNYLFGVKKSPKKEIPTERTKSHNLAPTVDLTISNASIAEPVVIPPKAKELDCEVNTDKDSTEDDTKQGPLSPLQMQKNKLRSVKERVHSDSSSVPIERTDDVTPLSPYQAQRQRLRATTTKPRTYNCSILLVEGDYRDHCKSARSRNSVTEKAGTDDAQIPTTLNAKSSEIDSSVARGAHEAVVPQEDTESRNNPVETSSGLNSGEPVVPSRVDVTVHESLKESDNAGTSEVDAAVQKDETSTAPPEEPMQPDTALPSTNEKTRVSLEKHTRRPPRRISSENVLWKRAEMEIRSQMDRARNRLDRYRIHCSKSRENHSKVQSKLLEKLESVHAKLSAAKVVSTGVTSAQTEIVAEAMNWNDGVEEEQRQCEGDLVLHMHYMIALEKQEELFVRELSAIKTFLLRCKAWLQDYETIQKYLSDLEASNMALQTAYKGYFSEQQKSF